MVLLLLLTLMQIDGLVQDEASQYDEIHDWLRELEIGLSVSCRLIWPPLGGTRSAG